MTEVDPITNSITNFLLKEVDPIIGATSVTTTEQLGKTGFLQPGQWKQRRTRGECVREARRHAGLFGEPGKAGTHSFADGRSNGERAPNGASSYAQNSHRGCSFDP